MWYRHVSRSSGLAKIILQGTVKGGRRQGRQRKRWEDNIREWIGLEFAKSQRAVENRENWRKLVVKSSEVAHCSPRWRDGWGDMRRACDDEHGDLFYSVDTVKPTSSYYQSYDCSEPALTAAVCLFVFNQVVRVKRGWLLGKIQSLRYLCWPVLST